MRLSRLTIDAGKHALSLDLHPRLTVIAGIDERGRAALTTELLGGLGPTRSGLTLELTEDRGRRLRVERPRGGRHRVLDVETGADVTDEYTGADGTVDLYARHGLSPDRAAGSLHVERFESNSTGPRTAELVERLSAVDQTALWSASARVTITAETLDELSSTAVAADHEDEELVARIEQEHQSLETAIERYRRLNRLAMLTSTVSLASAAALVLVSTVLALPLVAVAIAAVACTFVYRARVDAGYRREAAALAEAGAQSYLGFVSQRVDDLLAGTDQRRRVVDVADDHRLAAAAWTKLAGDAEVRWALDHRREIETVALLRRQLRQRGHGQVADQHIRSAAAAVVGHLDRLRRIGSGREAFPVVVDNPFPELSPTERAALLDLLAHAPGVQQVIVLTDLEDVATWASIESPTGSVALVAPQAQAQPEAEVVVPLRRASLAG